MKTHPLPEPLSLLERKLESVRDAIGEEAARLFLEKGFPATTVEDIARAAGIGRRTFFRYFKSKEDVVLWKFDQFARGVLERIGQRPEREAPLTALQHALTDASEFYNREPAKTLAILRLTEETPSLYAQQLLQQDRWKIWFADALRKRTRDAARSPLPELTASVALSAMAIAVRRWVDDPKCDLSRLIADCFVALRKVVPPTQRAR